MAKKRRAQEGSIPSEGNGDLAAREEELNALETRLNAEKKQLKTQQNDLKVAQEALRSDREQFEQERSFFMGDARPYDLLRLNIGGTKTVTVQRRTMTCIPGSMLASKFSGRWDESIAKDGDGNFFIDHNYTDFGPILDFLRNKVLGDDPKNPVRPPSLANHGENEKANFYRLVEYYGLTEAMYPLQTTFATSRALEEVFRANTLVLVNKMSEACAFAKKLKDGAFFFTPYGHERKIKTIEVKTLQKLQTTLQVAWCTKIDFGEDGVKLALVIKPNKYPYFIDKDSIVDGTEYEIDYFSDSSELTIRSEDYGKRWFVNGIVFKPKVATQMFLGDDPSSLIPSVWHYSGEVEVTDIELSY